MYRLLLYCNQQYCVILIWHVQAANVPADIDPAALRAVINQQANWVHSAFACTRWFLSVILQAAIEDKLYWLPDSTEEARKAGWDMRQPVPRYVLGISCCLTD